jgi:hypothetical protein
MEKKEKEQRIKNLALKYGRKSVRNARANAEREERKTGKEISFSELKKRIEDGKGGGLKRGEVKRWDPNKKKWISNKEEVNEKNVYDDGHDYTKGLAITGRLDFGQGKESEYDVGVSYKGNVLARKTKKFDKKERTSAKQVVDNALEKLSD